MNNICLYCAWNFSYSILISCLYSSHIKEMLHSQSSCCTEYKCTYCTWLLVTMAESQPCWTLVLHRTWDLITHFKAWIIFCNAAKFIQYSIKLFSVRQEQDMLYQRSTEVSGSTFKQPNRYVKLWVKLVTPLIKNFFWNTAWLSG